MPEPGVNKIGLARVPKRLVADEDIKKHLVTSMGYSGSHAAVNP
jgi:hypothetical protein